jgi:trimeric autotransporter adhesin
MTYQQFINMIYPGAVKASQQTGISVRLILAQAAQETGWGNKILLGSNNLFNIKADKSWAGNDALNGGVGSDAMIGGLGNDVLYGGIDGDTYVFNQGDGSDTIKDIGNATDMDTIKFGAGITTSDIAFYMNGSNLSIEYGATDKVTINSQSNSSYAIERFELSDGSYLTNTDINQLIQNITSYATANGISINNVDAVRANNDLMNIVASSWHQA